MDCDEALFLLLIRKEVYMPKEATVRLIMIIMCLPCSDLREAVTRLRTAEVNAVSGVLKLYFRELPEPLVPTELFQSLARMLGKTDNT